MKKSIWWRPAIQQKGLEKSEDNKVISSTNNESGTKTNIKQKITYHGVLRRTSERGEICTNKKLKETDNRDTRVLVQTRFACKLTTTKKRNEWVKVERAYIKFDRHFTEQFKMVTEKSVSTFPVHELQTKKKKSDLS